MREGSHGSSVGERGRALATRARLVALSAIVAGGAAGAYALAATTGDPVAGKKVFQTAGCTGCHTLSAAGSSGTVGPSLDQRKPAYDLVIQRVTGGKGVMPSFSGALTAQQIADVAAFVSQSTGGAGPAASPGAPAADPGASSGPLPAR